MGGLFGLLKSGLLLQNRAACRERIFRDAVGATLNPEFVDPPFGDSKPQHRLSAGGCMVCWHSLRIWTDDTQLEMFWILGVDGDLEGFTRQAV